MREEGTKRSVDSSTFNIQDGYFARLRREKIITTIYLVNGVKLIGRIKSFDKFSMLIENNHQEQLIFKHAISTITYNTRPYHRPSYPPQAGYNRDRYSESSDSDSRRSSGQGKFSEGGDEFYE